MSLIMSLRSLPPLLRTWRQALLSSSLALAVAGCGAPPQVGGEIEAPALYAVQENVNAPQGRLVYVHLLPSLEAGGTLDGRNAIELNGYSTVQAFDGALFTAEEETRQITRWEVDATGKPAVAGRMSFANEELDTFWNKNFLYLSPERAYYANAPASEVIVWNPKRMEITGRIALPGLSRDGLTLSFSGLTRVGDRVFLPLSWVNWDTNQVYPYTQMAVLSATEDRLLAVWQDQRCGSAVSTLPDVAVTEDGTYYLVGDTWYGAFRYMGSPTPPPACVLRVKPGAEGFDPDWVETLEDGLAGHSDMSTLLIDEATRSVYTQLVRTPTAPFSTMDDVWAYLDANTVRVRCSLDSWKDCTPVAFEGVSHWFITRLDGRVLMTSLLGPAASNCVAYEVKAGAPQRLFQTSGFISNIVRVR